METARAPHLFQWCSDLLASSEKYRFLNPNASDSSSYTRRGGEADRFLPLVRFTSMSAVPFRCPHMSSSEVLYSSSSSSAVGSFFFALSMSLYKFLINFEFGSKP